MLVKLEKWKKGFLIKESLVCKCTLEVTSMRQIGILSIKLKITSVETITLLYYGKL